MDEDKNPTENVSGNEEEAGTEQVCKSTTTPVPSEDAHFQAIQNQIYEAVPALMSSDTCALLIALKSVTKILSRILNQGPPAKKMIDSACESGIVPRLVELSSHIDFDVQFQTVLALHLLARANLPQKRYLVDCGALRVFKQRLEDGQEGTKYEALCGINQISIGHHSLRNACLEYGVMPLVVEVLSGSSVDNQIMASNVLCVLCRNDPSPLRKDVISCLAALETIARRKSQETHIEVLSRVLWCLYFLSDAGADSVVEIFETGVAPYVLEKTRVADAYIIIPALKVLKMFCSRPAYADLLIQQGYLWDLERLMKRPDTTREACQNVASLLDGTLDQNYADVHLMPEILDFISNFNQIKS